MSRASGRGCRGAPPGSALEVVAMKGPNIFIETELGVPATTRRSTRKKIVELVRKETHAHSGHVDRRDRPGTEDRRGLPRGGRQPGTVPARKRVERRPPAR